LAGRSSVQFGAGAPCSGDGRFGPRHRPASLPRYREPHASRSDHRRLAPANRQALDHFGLRGLLGIEDRDCRRSSMEHQHVRVRARLLYSEAAANVPTRAPTC
jgi:hypothetical protein